MKKIYAFIVSVLIIIFGVSLNSSSSKLNPQLETLGWKVYTKLSKKKEYLIVVDFTLSSKKKRMWVFDSNKKLVWNTWVAHGTGSGGEYATKFSNIEGSHQSSIGVMKTGETYYGKHGLSLKLDGLEKWNTKVRERSVVIHGATYIGDGKTGRSWGCLAVPSKESKQLINLIKSGAIVINYYPKKDWLDNSKYLK